jgi:hypothetical protein
MNHDWQIELQAKFHCPHHHAGILDRATFVTHCRDSSLAESGNVG